MSKWIIEKIEGLADTYAGGTPSRSNPEYFKGEIPWISSGEVNQSKIYETQEKITEDALKNSSAKWIPKNSILVAMYGATAGQVSTNLIDATSNQAVLALIPFKDKIESDFLYYSLSYNKHSILFLTQGTGQPNLSKGLVDNFSITLPESLIEQRKIALILSTADAVIEKTQAAIAKYKAIKQGMLQDLFTRGLMSEKVKVKSEKGEEEKTIWKLRPRFEDAPELYKESRLGWIPKEWEEKELGDVGEVRMCRRVFNYETKEQGEIPFYKIGTFGKEPDAYISKDLYDSYRQDFSFPKKEDILISAAGTIGRTIIYDGTPSYFQDSNIVWIDNNGALISNEYLYQVFQVVKYKTEGGTIQRLYNSILKSANFPCPSKPEQQLITERLTAIDTKLQTEQAYLQKIQQLKKGLMEDLLSGKKRVQVQKELKRYAIG